MHVAFVAIFCLPPVQMETSDDDPVDYKKVENFLQVDPDAKNYLKATQSMLNLL